jgi:hypothetical protein
MRIKGTVLFEKERFPFESQKIAIFSHLYQIIELYPQLEKATKMDFISY